MAVNILFPDDNSPAPTAGVNAAVITIGEVSADDSAAKYILPTDGGFIWTDYEINNRYESDKKIYMMGITSPGGFNGASVAFAQIASPTLLWICDWTASRFNKQPIAPNSASVNTNWILLDEHLEPAMLVVGEDGVTPYYRLSGTYVYGNLNPSAIVANDISFTRPPWLEDVFSRNMPLELFQSGLMEQTGAGEGLVNPGQEFIVPPKVI